MAHVITETPVFTPSITVPDGTDSRVNAAEVVAAIAQGLGNRSQYLKLNGLFADVVNTLLEGLVIANPSATQPSIDVTTNADDAGAAWKLILRAEIGGGANRLRLYTSNNSGAVRAIITTNAGWTGAAWALDNSGIAATALALSAVTGLGLQVWRKPSGSAPWTTWDDAGVTAETVQANASISAGTTVSAFTSMSAGTTVTAGTSVTAPSFLYNKTRTVPVSLGNTHTNFWDVIGASNFGAIVAQSTSVTTFIALRVPENMGSAQVQVMYTKASTGASVFSLYKLVGDWISFPPTLTSTVIDSIAPTAIGTFTGALNIPSVDPAGEYRLSWAAGHVDDQIYAVRVVGMVDRGPINTL